MAHEEMQTVGDLDVPTLALNKKIIWAYFADVDGWVGNLQRDEIVVALSSADDPDDGHRVILADGGVPHAFCISTVAIICLIAKVLTTACRSQQPRGIDLFPMAHR
jgi:hypothetical protein